MKPRTHSMVLSSIIFLAAFTLCAFFLFMGPWYFSFIPIPLLVTILLSVLLFKEKSSYLIVIFTSFGSFILYFIISRLIAASNPIFYGTVSFDDLATMTTQSLLVSLLLPIFIIPIQAVCGVFLFKTIQQKAKPIYITLSCICCILSVFFQFFCLGTPSANIKAHNTAKNYLATKYEDNISILSMRYIGNRMLNDKTTPAYNFQIHQNNQLVENESPEIKVVLFTDNEIFDDYQSYYQSALQTTYGKIINDILSDTLSKLGYQSTGTTLDVIPVRTFFGDYSNPQPISETRTNLPFDTIITLPITIKSQAELDTIVTTLVQNLQQSNLQIQNAVFLAFEENADYSAYFSRVYQNQVLLPVSSSSYYREQNEGHLNHDLAQSTMEQLGLNFPYLNQDAQNFFFYPIH